MGGEGIPKQDLKNPAKRLGAPAPPRWALTFAGGLSVGGVGAAGVLGNTACRGAKHRERVGSSAPHPGPAPPHPAVGLLPVLTPSRRLRRPSGLSSGASPEVPASLAESFWGMAQGQNQGHCLCPSWGASLGSPTPVLTSELRKDRKGIREFEGLVSANRGRVSWGPWGPCAVNTCSLETGGQGGGPQFPPQSMGERLQGGKEQVVAYSRRSESTS